jgi:DNA-binding NarL/FixJ family response regulator
MQPGSGCSAVLRARADRNLRRRWRRAASASTAGSSVSAGSTSGISRWKMSRIPARLRWMAGTRIWLGWPEQAVACLAAEGLNNNQVAARLYISSHTVAHHLRQAFRKLSITSRVELARIVIEQAADGASQRN